MVKLMDLAKYVVEEGLVGHHWEEILGPVKVLCPSKGCLLYTSDAADD